VFWACVALVTFGSAWLAVPVGQGLYPIWLAVARSPMRVIEEWAEATVMGRSAIWIPLFFDEVPHLVVRFLMGMIIALAIRRHWLWIAVLFAVASAIADSYAAMFQFRPYFVVTRMAVLLATPLAGGWLAARLLARRVHDSAGCGTCGYDLTGNVSGVCPECGTPIEVVRASADDGVTAEAES